MFTASILSAILVYLIGLKADESRANKVNRKIEQYKEITVCSVIDL